MMLLLHHIASEKLLLAVSVLEPRHRNPSVCGPPPASICEDRTQSQTLIGVDACQSTLSPSSSSRSFALPLTHARRLVFLLLIPETHGLNIPDVLREGVLISGTRVDLSYSSLFAVLAVQLLVIQPDVAVGYLDVQLWESAATMAGADRLSRCFRVCIVKARCGRQRYLAKTCELRRILILSSSISTS